MRYIAFLFLMLFPCFVYADGEWINKREIGVLIYSTPQEPYINGDMISQRRGGDYGFFMGLEDVFTLFEAPIGIFGQFLTTTSNYQVGLSVKPIDKIQLRGGLGFGEVGYKLETPNGDYSKIPIRKEFGPILSGSVNYQFEEVYSLGIGIDSNLSWGFHLGLRF